MTDNNLMHALRFEDFSDEILLEIFKYFKTIDLSRFIGLNQRLNNVVHDIKLKVTVEYSNVDHEGHDFLLKFRPDQFISLNFSHYWDKFEINRFEQLRSISLSFNMQNKHQFKNLLNVSLPYLERLSIDQAPCSFRQKIFRWIMAYGHFPLLNFCRFSSDKYFPIEFDPDEQIVNLTIRTLILNATTTKELNSLFDILPNLYNLEATLENEIGKLTTIHTSLEHLCLTFRNSAEHFENILLRTPHLKQLRLNGKIEDSSVLIFFEKLARFIHVNMLQLEIFNCELFSDAWDPRAEILAIHQLHPLFKSVVRHRGNFMSDCYATDLTEYPIGSKYSCPRSNFYSDGSNAFRHFSGRSIHYFETNSISRACFLGKHSRYSTVRRFI